MTTVLEKNSREDNVSTRDRITSRSAPSRSAALQQYRARAPIYDLQAAAAEPLRKQAIDRLTLNPGETVIDAGCGTGLSFTPLEEAVGQQGAIVGIELSPSMIEQARARVARHRWGNVTLLNAPVEEAIIPVKADAALFCFTHDIMRRRAAVKNVVNHLKPGARVVSVGLKWAEAPGLLAVNMMVWNAAMWSTTTLEGLSSPWSHLEDLVGELWVEEFQPGAFYIATGIVPD
jgi:SAM-dependent methyltransferase